jgi:glycosyltransferase involved in cell wall biosynthesis
MKVSVVIPCYNDGLTIGPIIKEAKKCSKVTEIIVINDGSDRKTSGILKKISGIILINLPQNHGKSNALWQGVINSKTNNIVFLDADYSGFNQNHIDLLIDPLLSGNYDSVIGELGDELPIFRLSGNALMLSGARSYKKQLLQKHPELFHSHGYVDGFLIETFMNRVFLRKARVAKVILRGLSNKYKYKKIGYTGLFKDLLIQLRIFKAVGYKEVTYQLQKCRQLKSLN